MIAWIWYFRNSRGSRPKSWPPSPFSAFFPFSCANGYDNKHWYVSQSLIIVKCLCLYFKTKHKFNSDIIIFMGFFYGRVRKVHIYWRNSMENQTDFLFNTMTKKKYTTPSAIYLSNNMIIILNYHHGVRKKCSNLSIFVKQDDVKMQEKKSKSIKKKSTQ